MNQPKKLIGCQCSHPNSANNSSELAGHRKWRENVKALYRYHEAFVRRPFHPTKPTTHDEKINRMVAARRIYDTGFSHSDIERSLIWLTKRGIWDPLMFLLKGDPQRNLIAIKSSMEEEGDRYRGLTPTCDFRKTP